MAARIRRWKIAGAKAEEMWGEVFPELPSVTGPNTLHGTAVIYK